jgi:hypothetical protein
MAHGVLPKKTLELARRTFGPRPIFLHQREKLDKEIVAPRLGFPGSSGHLPTQKIEQNLAF